LNHFEFEFEFILYCDFFFLFFRIVCHSTHMFSTLNFLPFCWQ